jgi:type VI secretion system secreted protein Hcp
MATHSYLQADPIKGESTDDKHKDWIEVLSYGIGVSQPISGPSGTGGRGASRADFHALTITKLADISSPDLFQYCALGKHIAKLKLEVCQETGDKIPFVEIELENVMVSGVSNSGGGSDRPYETVTFVYDKITWKNTAINNDGTKGSELEKKWNLQTNAES